MRFGNLKKLSDFTPTFKSKKPKKFMDEKWLRTDEPQVILFQGMRGGGKGVAVDKTAEELYKEGVNIWHIWGARSFENLYWAINKNCKEKYDKIKLILRGFENNVPLKKWARHNRIFEKEFEYYFEIIKNNGLVSVSEDMIRLEKLGREFLNGEVLHCNCHKSYPISWIVPDYVEIDQESLDRFNGQYWKDMEEYKEHFLEITSHEKQLLLQGKLKKPKQYAPKPKIIIKTITPPTNASRKEIFQKQFTDIVVHAREENRIVVMNPAIFEFANDKFDTLAEIIRMIPYLMNKSGLFSPLSESDVGKPKKYWTKKQKSWHKVAIIINELRSVAPSSRLSGEKESSKSKKAIYDFIPEARHMKTWFLGDYQNPDDLYAGVRYQANIVVIKRASRNILGSDWTWLFEKIERDRMGLLRKAGKRIERPEEMWQYERHPQIKKYLDDRRPRIDEMADNIGYLTFINGEVARWRFDMPSFHHKMSLEDFQKDTGIMWKINTKKAPKETTATNSQQNKKIKEDILKKIHQMHADDDKSFKQIKDELVQMEKNGVIPNMGYEDKEPIYFNNLWNRWKTRSNTK